MEIPVFPTRSFSVERFFSVYSQAGVTTSLFVSELA
jgi:hypothetical protein